MLKFNLIYQLPPEISSCLVELWPYPTFVVRQGFELGIGVGLVGDVVGPGLPRPARLDVDGVRGPGDPGSNLRPLELEVCFRLLGQCGRAPQETPQGRGFDALARCKTFKHESLTWISPRVGSKLIQL